MKTLEDWIKLYERKTGETFDLSQFHWDDQQGWISQKNMHLKIVPGWGFFCWAISKKNGLRYLYLDQCCGFVKYFVPYIREVMRLNKLEWIVTATQRDPKAHMRKWKMKRLSEYDYDFEGRHYFVLIGHISNLK